MSRAVVNVAAAVLMGAGLLGAGWAGPGGGAEGGAEIECTGQTNCHHRSPAG